MQVDLFVWVALVTVVSGVLWILDLFTLGVQRARAAQALAQQGGSHDQIEQALQTPAYSLWLGRICLWSILPLLFLAIRRSMDFSILLVIATAVSGLIYLLDGLLLKRLRNKIVTRLAELYNKDDPLLQKAMVEPELVEYSRSFFPVLLIVLVLRSFLIEPFQIPSGSMKPTLLIGDFIAVNKFSYGFRLPVTGQQIIPVGDPKTGDMIVFKPPHEPNKTFIKRVIGVPGDQIRYDYRSKRLWINGEEATKRYIGDEFVDGEPLRVFEESLGDRTHLIYQAILRNNRHPDEWIPAMGFTVPEGKYFVMGDNRDNSYDSRYWKFVDENAILGKAFAIWLHWPTLGSVPSFSRNGLVD